MNMPLDSEFTEITDNDTRYDPRAYTFVLHTFQSCMDIGGLNDDDNADDNNSEADFSVNLSGKDLLKELRDEALDRFGPLAYTVLTEWGITRTEDFGEIVFNLVKAHYIQASCDDSKDDFENGYDFRETFLAPFEL